MKTNVDNSSAFVDNSSPEHVWNMCLKIIKEKVNPQTFHTWFLPIVPVKLENRNLTIQVPSQFFYEWLEEHYPHVIRSALFQILGEGATPYYLVKKHSEEEDVSQSDVFKVQFNTNYSDDETHLNSRYTFEKFVEGRGNQFAKAASLAVAEAPGKTSFNPLVIYGGVGLGKTHLVQAIGNFSKKIKSAKKIRYVSSEKFTIDFINSIQNNFTAEFSRIYRNVDLLLVDDIQFFMSKERTQEEFFHTFNALQQKEKQIVLTSDRPPKELRGLEERLLSRFQSGLIVDIQPPDLETRIAILQQKADEDEIDLPMEIIEYIASNITSNIRELEGALIKLLAYSSLRGVDITLELAKTVLKDIVIRKHQNISIEQIQKVVCEHFSIPDDLLRGKSRKQEIVFARQIAMYLSKELTRYSLKSIGLHFGGRDHTTVIHAVRSINKTLKDSKVKKIIEDLKKKIEIATM